MHVVEKHLTSLPESQESSIRAILWITHSEEQRDLATRLIHVQDGAIQEQTIQQQA